MKKKNHSKEQVNTALEKLENKQYGYLSSVFRAIRNFENKYGKHKRIEFGVNQLDEDCFELTVFYF